MEDQAECVVTGILARALLVSKFVGLAPLRFVKTDIGWRVSMAPNLYIFGCLMVIVTNVTVIVGVIGELQEHQVNVFNTKTHQVVWVAHVMILTLTWSLMVYSSPSYMRCMMNSLDQVQKIISELNGHHWSPQWKKIQIGLYMAWMIICTTFIIIAAVFIFTFFEILHQTMIVKMVNVLYYVFYGVVQLSIVVFTMVVFHVQSGFKAVNYCLENLLRDIEEQQGIIVGKNSDNTIKTVNNYIDTLPNPKIICSDNTTNSNPHHETVRGIASAYAAACVAVRDVTRSFGMMLMMLLSGIFLHLVTSPYFFITDLVVEHSQEPTKLRFFILKEVLHFFRIIFQSANLVMIIEPCHMTHTEMESTRELVSRLMRRVRSRHDPLVIELEQFCLQLETNDVSYKLLNVATMDRGLVMTILSSIATYLVILVDINSSK